MSKQTKVSSVSLKEVLWETIKNIKENKITTQKANAISSASRTICSVVKLEILMAKRVGKKASKVTNSFIS